MTKPSIKELGCRLASQARRTQLTGLIVVAVEPLMRLLPGAKEDNVTAKLELLLTLSPEDVCISLGRYLENMYPDNELADAIETVARRLMDGLGRQ